MSLLNNSANSTLSFYSFFSQHSFSCFTLFLFLSTQCQFSILLFFHCNSLPPLYRALQLVKKRPLVMFLVIIIIFLYMHLFLGIVFQSKSICPTFMPLMWVLFLSLSLSLSLSLLILINRITYFEVVIANVLLKKVNVYDLIIWSIIWCHKINSNKSTKIFQ